jgi:hypothetical protein
MFGFICGPASSIDGTENVPGWSGFARFINHSVRRPNLKPHLMVDASGVPHIVLFSCRDLEAGDELLFDYGERDKQALTIFPWLKDA